VSQLSLYLVLGECTEAYNAQFTPPARHDGRAVCAVSGGVKWVSLAKPGQLDHPRVVAFSEEVSVQSYATDHSVFTFCVAYNVAACGRPAWPASRRRWSTGKRDSLVLSGVAVWTDRRKSASHCAARHRTDTERTYLAVEPTEFTPPHQTRQQKSCLCLAWRCELALMAATVRELGLHRYV